MYKPDISKLKLNFTFYNSELFQLIAPNGHLDARILAELFNLELRRISDYINIFPKPITIKNNRTTSRNAGTKRYWVKKELIAWLKQNNFLP